MRRPARILVGTGNPDKLSEIRDLLAPTGIVILAPRDMGWNPEVTEDGATLAENALKKARAGAEATGLVTVADDSGLFVDALGEGPGIRSARYAGSAQDPAANRRKLLDALRDVPEGERGAEFRAAVALVAPEEEERVFEGACRGTITRRERGEEGFGYDPVFRMEGGDRTFAELSAGEKHERSHRGRALAALRAFLAGLPPSRTA